jgi:hypothetical protein
MGTGQTVASVGKNAMGMVPVQGGTPTGLFIAVPCLGGTYQYGTTNGAESALYKVTGIFASMVAAPAIIGEADTAPDGTTYDIKSVAFSEDGLYGYLLCLTYTSLPDPQPCWKIYQTTATKILSASGITISAAVTATILDSLTGQDSATGNDWELLYENDTVPANGRLWFVQGTVIQVSKGNDYSVKKTFVYLYDVSARGYVNSADLIGEMIYQYGKGHSIDTRLIKGKAAAKVARVAARAAAAAPEEEEEEK